jgi:hypothetical protein
VPDVVFRVGFVVVFGLILAIAVAWYAHTAYQLFTGRGQVVIDPLTVFDGAGRQDADLGKALAHMLQVRLQSLDAELRAAETALSAPVAPHAPDVERLGDIRQMPLWKENIALDTRLLEPIDLKLDVGGVEVGGVIAWLQRQLTGQKTLHFTIYKIGDQVRVVGSVAALGLSGSGLEIMVSGCDGRPPSLDTIVDHLAHELVHRLVAQGGASPVQLLHADEFMNLSAVVLSAAELNQRAQLGLSVDAEFAALIPQVSPLCDLAPSWDTLNFLGAWVADRGHDRDTAIKYYRQTLNTIDATKHADVVELIKTRLAALQASTPALAAAPPVVDRHVPAADKVDYAQDVELVHDSGAEGSVVGQALAALMEIQLQRMGYKIRISARYLYYIARGNAREDVGATLKDGVAALKKSGAIEESAWPYVPGHYADKPPDAVRDAKRIEISNVRRVTSLDGFKASLAQNGPLVVGITMYESAMTPAVQKTGQIPVPNPKEQVLGGHAVVLVGYDDKAQQFKFLNSWGAGWGDHGFGYLPYQFVEKNVSEGWTFDVVRP